MDAKKQKVKFSNLKRKLNERVKRSREPFKGTLVSLRMDCPQSSEPDNEEQTSELEREQSKDPASFDVRLIERFSFSKEPFRGRMWSLSKTN